MTSSTSKKGICRGVIGSNDNALLNVTRWRRCGSDQGVRGLINRVERELQSLAVHKEVAEGQRSLEKAMLHQASKITEGQGAKPGEQSSFEGIYCPNIGWMSEESSLQGLVPIVALTQGRRGYFWLQN